MNKVIASLIVLAAVAVSSPAFAKPSPAAAPVKGAKITTTKATSKVAAPVKHKQSKSMIKKTK
jgi:hypothetical protein